MKLQLLEEDIPYYQEFKEIFEEENRLYNEEPAFETFCGVSTNNIKAIFSRNELLPSILLSKKKQF